MGEKVEINIFSRTPLISDLHETITSIINALGFSKFQIYVTIDAPAELPLDTELARLKKAGINYGEASDARFTMSLESGEVISKSYLYKATEYLKLNSAGFVSPEYTIKRAAFRPILAVINNASLPLDATKAPVIDRAKLNNESISPLAATIKDTCVASQEIPTSLDRYLRSKAKSVSLSGPFLTKSHLEQISKPSSKPSRRNNLKQSIKALCGRSKVLRKAFACNDTDCDRSKELPDSHYEKNTIYISNQMRNELESIASIKYAIKGYDAMKYANLTPFLTKNYRKLFNNYLAISGHFSHENYDYIMVLPWLISGGIDLFAINYLKTVAKLHPDYNILVFLTNGFHRSFTKDELNLPENIDFVNLPEILGKNISDNSMEQIVHSSINIFSPKYLHIIASKVGYNVVIKSGDTFRKDGVNILFSSYNYLLGPHHEYMGYSVEELPKAYRLGDIVTTDNEKSKSIWTNQYGFREEDVLVHNQLFDNIPTVTPSSKDGIKILWAAHIRPEKNPQILPEIANALKDDHVEIDCYGLFTKDNWKTEENPLDTAAISNLHYKGPYNDFFKDINLADYDLFLYTSHADGTPNVILEAALAGLPIVSSDIGGIAEATAMKATLVKDTYSATDFVSAIRSVLAHHDESKKNAEKLRNELLTAHSEETFKKQTESMLRSK